MTLVVFRPRPAPHWAAVRFVDPTAARQTTALTQTTALRGVIRLKYALWWAWSQLAGAGPNARSQFAQRAPSLCAGARTPPGSELPPSPDAPAPIPPTAHHPALSIITRGLNCGIYSPSPQVMKALIGEGSRRKPCDGVDELRHACRRPFGPVIVRDADPRAAVDDSQAGRNHRVGEQRVVHALRLSWACRRYGPRFALHSGPRHRPRGTQGTPPSAPSVAKHVQVTAC